MVDGLDELMVQVEAITNALTQLKMDDLSGKLPLPYSWSEMKLIKDRRQSSTGFVVPNLAVRL